MCWCRPEVRTPNCGRPGCKPPDETISQLKQELAKAKKQLDYWTKGYTWEECAEMYKDKEDLRKERDEARLLAFGFWARLPHRCMDEEANLRNEHPWLFPE